MKTKTIIFDLDGTLVDSIKDIGNAMNTVLRDMNFREHSYDEYYYFAGAGIKNLVIACLPEEGRTSKNIEYAYTQMMTIYKDNLLVETSLYPGISEMLDKLTEHNIILNVFSNKAHELALLVADKLLNKWDFNIVLGTGETPNKPNPQGANMILEKLNLQAREALFVGDTDVDMNTAKNANIRGIGVLWGFREQDELDSAGAHACISTPIDLVNYLIK